MGKFVVNGAIDATSHITIKNGADLYLQAPSTNTSDSGDIVFTTYNGTEQGRLWISGGVGMIRFSSSDSSKTLIHSGNIGSQSVNYANSAGNSGTSNGIKLEWSGSIAWADTGWIAAWNSDGSKIKALNKNSFCPASGSDHYIKVYNSSAVGGASGITADTLASQGFAVAMINGATNNPTGAAKWIHCLNMGWGAGDNANWITQLAFGVENSDGAWYRTNAYTATNKPWKRILDSGNYTSYTVTKTGGGASGTWGINVTGQATYVRDSYNGSNITITYGKSGQSSTSWLASWNGYELGAIAPSSITAGWASGASYSNSSNALASTGWGRGNFTYLQTSEDFYGNSGWSHYLISNHGNGENYYNFVIALPFWSYPKYKRMNAGSAGSWYNFHTTENVIIQNATPGAGFYGQIWFKI